MSIILQWSKKSPIQVTVTTPFTLVVFAPSPLLVLDDPFQLAKQRKEMWEFTYLMKQYIYQNIIRASNLKSFKVLKFPAAHQGQAQASEYLVVPLLKAPTKIEDFDASMFSCICRKKSTNREDKQSWSQKRMLQQSNRAYSCCLSNYQDKILCTNITK